MTPEGSAHPPGVRRVRRRRTQQPNPRRRVLRRQVLVAGGVVVLALLGLGLWLGGSALHAQSDLRAASGYAERAKVALRTGDVAAAKREVDGATLSAAAARSRTATLPWTVVGAVPLLGQPVVAVRNITVAVDDLARQVLQPAANASGALTPGVLLPKGGQVDLAALGTARVPLQQAATAAQALAARVHTLPSAGWVPMVDDARDTLRGQLDQLAGLLGTASTAATLLPPMLGGDAPRHYFVAFQTNAEARGTGGLVGGYGILTADRGKVSLDTLASNRELASTGFRPIDLGADFAASYSGYGSTTYWQSSNISAHFPYAAQIWMSLWQQQSGQQLDGAIGTDPVALGYLLGAVGPVTLGDGEVVNADNVVRLTESQSYARFTDDKQRKAYLQSIAGAVVARTTNGAGASTTALLSALGRAAGEGRLAVYSGVPGEQQVLAVTPLGRLVPDTPAPYAGLVVNNAAGNKLDYYLGRSVSYSAGDCSARTRTSTVTATLRNGAPTSGLPAYVTSRSDRGAMGAPGTNRLLVSLYATAGAQLTSVTVDGVPTTAAAAAELGHPVFTVNLLSPPSGTQVLQFQLIEPTAAGVALVPVQPLVLPMDVRVDVPDCASRRTGAR